MRICVSLSIYRATQEEVIEAYPTDHPRMAIVSPATNDWVRVYDSLFGAEDESSFATSMSLAKFFATTLKRAVFAMSGSGHCHEFWITNSDGELLTLPCPMTSATRLTGQYVKAIVAPLIDVFPGIDFSNVAAEVEQAAAQRLSMFRDVRLPIPRHLLQHLENADLPVSYLIAERMGIVSTSHSYDTLRSNHDFGGAGCKEEWDGHEHIEVGSRRNLVAVKWL